MDQKLLQEESLIGSEEGDDIGSLCGGKDLGDYFDEKSHKASTTSSFIKPSKSKKPREINNTLHRGKFVGEV